MHNPGPLTKSLFVRGFDCKRRIWLDRNRPELKPPLSIADKARMHAGVEVGRLALLLYPDGVFVRRDSEQEQSAFAATQELMTAGHNRLFEATFVHGSRLARVDVLEKSINGGWILNEVKSSTLKKEPKDLDIEKLYDIAYQVSVAKACGIQVDAAWLTLVNTKYVWPGGDYDPNQLLGTMDVTSRCAELEEEITDKSLGLIDALTSPSEPDVITNTHCKSCDYFSHCHESRPKNDIIFFSDMRASAVAKLREKGYESITDIPDDEELTEKRTLERKVILTGRPHIGVGLAQALEAIQFPALFIDFETCMSALPNFVGTRPYQQICFQWSGHIMDSPDSEPEHYEFLPEDSSDPREEFCRTLWEIVRSSQSLVHYSRFEIGRIKELASEGFPYAQELLDAFTERTLDLEKIVAKEVVFEEFKGRTSIKVVLPALVPSMSYKDIAIGNGLDAAASYLKMISPLTSPEEASTIRESLLTYCCQDTLAMVEIYWALRKLAGLK